MWHRISIWTAAMAMMLTAAASAIADDEEYDDSNQPAAAPNEYRDRGAIDRYLSAEVWTDRSDGEYYDGDNVRINFRVNRDAFVAIYSVDTKGQVDLIFPNSPNDDNFVQGDQTYTLPRGNDDYDLVVDGPKGKEYLQIIASREQFPIPNWYRHSGIVNDNENPNDFMDNLNSQYFVRYDGQRFAYDRAVIYVNDWEPDYFHPVYYPVYPSWAVCSNLYIDYPWGGSVYIDGVYWGVAPLYIPRILVGWNTISIYDHYGYCWEHDVHISRYHTVILDRSIVRPMPGVMSKYKEVRMAGYVDPVTHGYPQYKQTVGKLSGGIAGGAVVGGKLPRGNAVVGGGVQSPNVDLPKKYARGAVKLVETPRGYESTGGAIAPETNADLSRRSVHFRDQAGVAEGAKTGGSSDNGSDRVYRTRRTVRGDNGAPLNESARVQQQRRTPQESSGNSSGYYQRKEGQVERRTPTRVEPQQRQAPRVEPQQRQAPRQESNPPRQAPKVEQRGGGERSGGSAPASKPANSGRGGGGGREKR